MGKWIYIVTNWGDFLNMIYRYMIMWNSEDSPTCENPHQKNMNSREYQN